MAEGEGGGRRSRAYPEGRRMKAEQMVESREKVGKKATEFRGLLWGLMPGTSLVPL